MFHTRYLCLPYVKYLYLPRHLKVGRYSGKALKVPRYRLGFELTDPAGTKPAVAEVFTQGSNK